MFVGEGTDVMVMVGVLLYLVRCFCIFLLFGAWLQCWGAGGRAFLLFLVQVLSKGLSGDRATGGGGRHGQLDGVGDGEQSDDVIFLESILF